MKTEWLEYLVAFKNYKTIDKTATFCHTTPQNVGKIFRHLEDEMDCELFDRSKRGMRLTEAGSALADAAETILSSVESLKQKYSRSYQKENLTGSIELVGDNIEILNNILFSFNAQHPDVNISFQELDMKNALKTILDNPQKIGLIPFPANEKNFKDIISDYEHKLNLFPLSVGKSLVLCANNSQLAERHSIKYSDLVQIKFAILSKNTSGDMYFLELLKTELGEKIKPIITNSSAYFYSNIAKNNFVGITTDMEYKNSTFPDKKMIIALPITDVAVHKNYLVYHHNKKYSAAEKALITLIGKYYRSEN